MAELKVVGQSEIRVDALLKVTGKAMYPQDLCMDGMLYGVTVRSTEPHAYIRVNIDEASKVKGVVKIFTHTDVPGANHHGVLFKDHEVFCSKKVRRIGDPIAFVAAESQEAAVEGAKKVRVEYDEIKAVFDPEEAIKDGAVRVHEDRENVIYHYRLRKGDVDSAFREAYAISENVYCTPMVDHAFLQPEAGISYIDDEGRVVVCASTQYPHFDRLEIAEALGVNEDRVRYINPAVGGAFGGREDITLQIHIAVATWELKRPVKTVYTREESFLAHSKRHPMKMYYKTAANKDGYLTAMEAKIIGDSGAYASWAINILRKAGVHSTGPYYIPNVKVDSFAVYTNNPFTGAMRGFGAAQVAVAYEQQVDILAEKLGISPVEMRLRNGFKRGSQTATGQILEEGVPLSRCIIEVSRLFEGGVME